MMPEEFDTWKADDGDEVASTDESAPGKETRDEGSEGATSPGDKEPAQDEAWTKTAALDERKKRQDAETRHVGEMRAANERIARLEGANQERGNRTEKPEEEFDWSDPEAAITSRVNALVTKALKNDATTRQTSRSERLGLKIAVSEEIAKEGHDDFEAVIPIWNAHVTQDPALKARMLASASPAEYAYNWAKRQGSSGELEKLRKENADLRAEKEGGDPPQQRPSNAGATGGGTKTGKKGLDPNGVLDDALDGR